MNQWIRKTVLGGCAIALALLLPLAPAVVRAAAAPDLAGMWEGKLAVDANTSLTVQFTFSKGSNGAYTAVLNSPDNAALKDTPVSGLTWDGANLKMQVPSLSGSYAGALKAGKLDGQWTQPGGALPLVLAPYEKPVLSQASIKALTGAWHGNITVATITQTLEFHLGAAPDGGLSGTFGIPEQGLANVPLDQIRVENGELSLKIPRLQGDYKGKIANNQISGRLKIPSPAIGPDGVELNLQRGEYKVPAVPLKLSAEQFGALKGKWQGQLELTNQQTQQKTKIRVILRFESNDKGEYVAFMDSPDQGANGVVVNPVTLVDGKLAATVSAIRGEFNGTLSGNTLTGEWVQAAANFRQEVTLTRQ